MTHGQFRSGDTLYACNLHCDKRLSDCLPEIRAIPCSLFLEVLDILIAGAIAPRYLLLLLGNEMTTQFLHCVLHVYIFVHYVVSDFHLHGQNDQMLALAL